MKKFVLLNIIWITNTVCSQIPNPYFEKVWQGFNTGIYPSGRFPSAVRMADLDNDGDIDAVIARGTIGNGFVVLMNQGTGSFSTPVSYASILPVTDLSVADLNADGWKDVVVSNTGNFNEGNTISVFLNNGNAVFGSSATITVGSAPAGLCTFDLDGDTDIDIACCNKLSGTVSIMLNTGNGTFSVPVNYPAGNNPHKIIASAINNDNFPDIVVANESDQKMNILFNGGAAVFSNRVEYNVLGIVASDFWACVESADMDNDGDNDILYSSIGSVIGSNGAVAYFKNNGDGTLNTVQDLPLAIFTGGFTDMEVADLNQDGLKDIIGASYSATSTDGYQVLLNNGAGFSQPVLRTAGAATFALACGDVNNDGKIDILTADSYSMQLTVHKNQGNAIFPEPVLFNTSNNYVGAIDAADIDHDGDLDIVTSASSIAAVGVHVTVLKNNGSGEFMPAIQYSSGTGGVRAKFRDLNGDGFHDLLFAASVNSISWNFYTAINNGDGTFGARQTWVAGGCGWSDIDAADMDNDGDKDVVITEWLGCTSVPLSARRIFIAKNNGNGTFSAPVVHVVNPFPGSLAIADFNGDGKMDLATGQSLSIDIHLGTGNGDLQSPVSYPTAQSPYVIIASDFNNDGNADIAACTETDYEGMSVLLGNGNGLFQPAQNYPGAYSPDLRNESGITAGDVDNDGDKDIMVSNWASNDLSIYLNDGTGHFNFQSRIGVYYGSAAPFFGEFTGDCRPDIVIGILRPFNLNNGGAVTVLKGLNTCTLPVNLLTLKAEDKNGNVIVSWTVSNETNLNKYLLTKSLDGYNFSIIGEIAATNMTDIRHYTFPDKNPARGFNYYRLLMEDLDGRQKKSEIVFVNRKPDSKLSLTISPNPSRNSSTISISGALRGNAHILLYDISGKKITTLYSGEINSNAFSTNLDLSLLKSGIYFVKLITNDATVVSKLLIE